MCRRDLRLSSGGTLSRGHSPPLQRSHTCFGTFAALLVGSPLEDRAERRRDYCAWAHATPPPAPAACASAAGWGQPPPVG